MRTLACTGIATGCLACEIAAWNNGDVLLRIQASGKRLVVIADIEPTGRSRLQDAVP